MKWPKYSTRGPLRGPCNICGVVDLLTDDHVPPKGCPRVSTMRMHQLIRVLGDGQVLPTGRQAQSGVKYRTLCKRCNSQRLGIECDPALISLAQNVDRFLSAISAGIVVPSHTLVRTRPQRVLRAVVGHSLAAAVERPADGDWDRDLVAYSMDSSCSFPTSARVHYWIYPFQQQVAIRDAGYLSLLKADRDKNPTIFMCLKFYPLAFMIVDCRDRNYTFDLPCLSDYGALPLDNEIEVPIYLKNLPGELWPEAPSTNHVVIYGGDPLFARSAR